MRSTALAVALSVASVSPAFAQGVDPSLRGPGSLADASPQRRRPMISVFLGFPAWYWWGYGGIPVSIGGRYLQPLLHDGLLPAVNDSISLEAGADLYALSAARFGASLSIPVEAMWALHFSNRFAGYLKLGLALELRLLGDWCWGGVCGGVLGVGWSGQLGIMYAITEAITLRVEVGYPGLKLGLGFPL